MRKETITEYLNEANDYIKQIKEGKSELEKDKNKKKLYAAKVTACLSLLRSCLDYCSHDIYDIILKPQDGLTDEQRAKIKKYFPYGKTKPNFDSMIGSSLPKLKNIDSITYDLIESIQYYKCGDMWLYNLCSITNVAKHDKSDQLREDKKAIKIDNGLTIVGGSIIVKAGGNIDGKKVEKDVVIGPDSDEDELKAYFKKTVKLDVTKFVFSETGQEIVSTLENAHDLINQFYKSLYNHLETNTATV